MGKSKKEQEMEERKELILKMLSEGRRISSTEILERLSKATGKPPLKSRTSIKDCIDELKREGYDIDSNDGSYLLIKDETVVNEEIPDDYICSDKEVVNEWIVMHVMQQRYDQYISFDRLMKEIENCFKDIHMTDYMLRKYLARLEELQFIEACGKDEVGTVVSETEDQMINGRSHAPKNKKYYHLTESAPVLSVMDKGDLNDFCIEYALGGISTELTDEMGIIKEKINQVIVADNVSGSDFYMTSGRKSRIPGEMKEKLEEFLKLPFKTKELLVSYPFVDGEKEISFMTGMIVYSTDKNELYLLGELDGQNLILRFDRIKKIIPGSKGKNTVYLDDKYRKMFEEAWSVPTEKEDDVEIRFQNVPYVRRFVEDLKRARGEIANVIYPEAEPCEDTEIQDPDSWIIYRDKIKGIDDFMPYIRSKGSSAIVIKPEKYRKLMMEKTAELIERYKEVIE